MTIKNSFLNVLKNAEKQNAEMRKKVCDICNSNIYTEEGKKHEVQKIQLEMQEYIIAKKKEIAQIVERKVKDVDAYEAMQTKERNNDINYQSLLANTLRILPAAVSESSPGDLKERLSIFADDPVAISALNAALKKNVKGLDSIRYMGVLPADNRGEKQKTLKKLHQTMDTLLDGMQITVLNDAYLGGDNVNAHTIPGINPIFATVDYINACNDDCTVYDMEKHYAQISATNARNSFVFEFSSK